jgi:hypothetical protein
MSNKCSLHDPIDVLVLVARIHIAIILFRQLDWLSSSFPTDPGRSIALRSEIGAASFRRGKQPETGHRMDDGESEFEDGATYRSTISPFSFSILADCVWGVSTGDGEVERCGFFGGP